MTDRPILFSAPMVCALLAGRKTQTRSVLRKQDWPAAIVALYPSQKADVPYATGDRLWVREALKLDESDHLIFAADGANVPTGDIPVGFSVNRRSAPGMFMPRWASRLTLVVTDVRVQRVQDIAKADVVAEGITGRDGSPLDDVHAGWHEPFAHLWDSINAKRGYGWDANPWVVAITFTVHKTNIDAMEAA